MYSRSLRSRMMVVRLVSSLFSIAWAVGLAVCIANDVSCALM